MDIKEYIASGILELYVLGALSEKENRQINQLVRKHDEIRDEVEEIEKALGLFSEAISPSEIIVPFDKIREAIENESENVIPLASKRKRSGNNFVSYSGWAASILLAGGLFWMYNQNQELSTEIQSTDAKNAFLEQQLTISNENLDKANELVTILRDKNIIPVSLAGQAAAPEAFAKVYIKTGDTKVYIDALGLPEPPRGKVYQVWSLKLNPLTPTSIGLLSDFTEDENKVFELVDIHEAEAFGITLEPEGGSDVPNLEQLYALGAVGR